jgi:hypothetical protein
LFDETQGWPPQLRTDVCEALLEAVQQQIKTPPCTELAFEVLGALLNESAMQAERLNRFFRHWHEFQKGEDLQIAQRLRVLERRYTKRDLVSRFRRYVIDVDWMEWDENFRSRQNKSKNHAKVLVAALAGRIARHPRKLADVHHLLAPKSNAPALWYFGEQLALNDGKRVLLPELTQRTLETGHQVCLHGYLSAIRASDHGFYLSILRGFLDSESGAWLGAAIALRSDYDDGLFMQCLDALEKKWVGPSTFAVLRFGRTIELIPPERTGRLVHQLKKHDSAEALFLLIELLDSLPLDESSPLTCEFVFDVVSRAIPDEEGGGDGMRGYYWKNVCTKLVKWDTRHALPLLDALLSAMGRNYSLSYHSEVALLANELVQADPAGAWEVVKTQLGGSLPTWRTDVLSWLKGGLSSFNEGDARGAIVDLPVERILEWVAEDSEARAALMAHAAPRTFEDQNGGRLTRQLLCNYGRIDGVQSGISATFHSGGWTGPTSAYLKRKRDKFRGWLAAGFETEVVQWIESELEYLDRSIEDEEINEERSRFD